MGNFRIGERTAPCSTWNALTRPVYSSLFHVEQACGIERDFYRALARPAVSSWQYPEEGKRGYPKRLYWQKDSSFRR